MKLHVVDPIPHGIWALPMVTQSLQFELDVKVPPPHGAPSALPIHTEVKQLIAKTTRLEVFFMTDTPFGCELESETAAERRCYSGLRDCDDLLF